MTNLANILSKLEGNADKLGLMLGYFGPMAALTELNPGKDWIWCIINEHEQVIRNFQIPSLDTIKANFDRFTRPMMTNGVMAWLLGYVLKEVGLGGGFDRIGRALSKAGEGIIGGSAVSTLVFAAGAPFGGVQAGNPAGQPYGGHNAYPAGAGYSPLARRDGGYFTMPNVPLPKTPTLSAILPASPRP